MRKAIAFTIFLLVLAALPWAHQVGAQQDGAVDDRKRLLGTWEVVAYEYDGARATDEQLKELGLQFVFEEKKTRVNTKKSKGPEYNYSLAPTKSPKEIVLAPFTQVEIEQLAIYAFEGEHLKICMNFLGTTPKGFPKDSSGHRIIDLRRAKK